MGGAGRARAGAASLCPGAVGAEERAFVLSSGNPRQWQTYPRVARYRRALGAPAFLFPRRIGAVDGHGTTRPSGAGRLRADHPVEFSVVDAGMEDRACVGGGQYGGLETSGTNLAHGASVCGYLPSGRFAQRCGQHYHRRWCRGRDDRKPQRHRQDRFHRLDRGGTPHQTSHGRQLQGSDIGVGGKVPLYRV